VVLVKYLNTAGIPHSLGTLPGQVIRAVAPEPDGTPRIVVCVFGDGPPNAPTGGAYPLGPIPLYDPTNPDDASTGEPITVPEAALNMISGPWAGKPVWAEWMPYQARKHAEARAAGGHDAPPR